MTKKKIKRRVKTEEPMGGKIVAPKARQIITKHDKERIKDAKKLKFKEFFTTGNKKGKRRCIFNRGTPEIPEQCKNGSFQNQYAFCRIHGKYLIIPKVISDGRVFVIEKTGAALQTDLKEIEAISKADLESLDNEIKVLMALARNYLKYNSDEELAKKPNNLRLIIETLVSAKKFAHEMRYGTQFSFSIDVVNYMVFQIKSIITKSVTDVEVLKKINEGFKTLSLEIKDKEY